MIKLALRYTIFAATSLALLGLSPANAGEDSARAEAYFAAITGGDPETIASYYADDAEFRWVGGPLAGLYKGKDKIKGVWAKFAAAAGNFSHEVLELNEIGSGTSTVVTAKVRFKGDGEVPVKFAITYRDGKIVSETWQVDKAGVVAHKAQPPVAAAKSEPAKTEASKAGEPKATILSLQTLAPESQAKASEARPATAAGQAAEVKPDAATSPVAPKTAGAQPEATFPEVKPAEISLAEPEADEIKPAEIKPAEPEVAEIKAAEIQPAEIKPAEAPAAGQAKAETPKAGLGEASPLGAAASAPRQQGPKAADENAQADYLPKGKTAPSKEAARSAAPSSPAAKNDAKNDVRKDAKSDDRYDAKNDVRSSEKAKLAKKAKPRKRLEEFDDVVEEDDDSDYRYGHGYSRRYYGSYYGGWRGYYGDYRRYRSYGRYGYDY